MTAITLELWIYVLVCLLNNLVLSESLICFTGFGDLTIKSVGFMDGVIFGCNFRHVGQVEELCYVYHWIGFEKSFHLIPN